MAVFASKHIDGQVQQRIIHHQGFSRQRTRRQGSQLLDPVMAFLDTVAIQQLDAFARQRGI